MGFPIAIATFETRTLQLLVNFKAAQAVIQHLLEQVESAIENEPRLQITSIEVRKKKHAYRYSLTYDHN